MLEVFHTKNIVEAGCDEAGRGCLAGPVVAAAVILPSNFRNDILNDSKKLTEKKRYALRPIIEKEALAWAVGVVDNRVTLGIKQLLEEEFQNTRYRLTEDDNTDFTANVEVLYIGKPNEAFSIIGLFNRRNQKTQVNLHVNLVNNLEGTQKIFRGTGEIETNVTATGLQIEEEADFGNTELGGAIRKAINDAVNSVE